MKHSFSIQQKKSFPIRTLRLAMMVFLVLLTPGGLEAASVSLSAPAIAESGKEFLVEVLVDPQGESINSVDITVGFSASQYLFSGYSAERGSIPLWIVTPKEIAPGVVRFSGVIPGGLERGYDPARPDRRELALVALRFIPQRPGDAPIAIEAVTILRNDGKGTEVGAATKDTVVAVRTASVVAGEESTDTVPPLPFVITIVDGSLFGRTPKLAIFETSDRESGVKRYEVSTNGRRFLESTSPYGVPPRLLPFTLSVRAIDFAGNVREESLVIKGRMPPFVAVIACALAVAIVIYIIVRARRRKNMP